MKKNVLSKQLIQINNMRYNQDSSLITLATSLGYRIISSKYFKITHSINEENINLGFLSLASLFYSSKLLLFVGEKINEKYKRNKLNIYDCDKNKILSSITLKENCYIIDFFSTKNILFLFVNTQILVFDFQTLNLIQSINNINIGYKLFSYSFNDIIAYTIFNKKYFIIIKSYNFNKENKVISAENRILSIPFESIQAIHLSNSSQYIIVFSDLGNKIHIYYCNNGALKNCYFIGEQIYSIENIEIYPHKENSFIFFANDKMLFFYLINSEDSSCVCYPYKDDEILGRTLSFFGFIKSYFYQVLLFILIVYR